MKRTVSKAKPSTKPAAIPAASDRRERNKLDKRDRIIAAAWSLFVKQGYDATTTKQIAERADIATGTLFLYAPDKLDLLAMLYQDRIARAVDDAFATLPARARLGEQVMHLFTRFFRMYGEQPELGKRFVRQLLLANGPNADRVNLNTISFVARLQGLIANAEQQGKLSGKVPSMTLAQLLFGLYFTSLMTWVMGYATLETALDPLLRHGVELLLRGAAKE